MKSYSVTKYIVNIIFLVLFTLAPIPTKAVHAQGIVITVNTLSDELNSNGLCSLREAIINANANDKIQSDCSAGFGEDGIVFIPALEPVTIYLTSALPNISDPAGLTIDGAGDISINGSGTYRAFIVNELASLTLQNMVIVNTYHSQEGGAIYNAGDLYIFNSSFHSNTTPYQGGAIYQPNLIGSSLFIENSVFFNNFSGTRGGAITIEGGNGQIFSTSFIQNQTDLSSGDGGAIYIADAGLYIHTSVFYKNKARFGATLYSIGGDTDLILRNSTFAYNVAFGSGTIAVNDGNIILSNSTIANNTSQTGLFVIGGQVHTYLYNTILANTTSASGSGFDCSSSSIYDFIGNNNLLEVNLPALPCEIVNGVNGNIVGLDPNLGDMVVTPVYHLPLNSGSPAIDAGNNCEPFDQRGVSRPQGVACDIGAVEKSVTVIRAILPSNGAQDGWVRESSETSEVGGTIDASASVLIVGDDAADRQYRSVLSFDTSSLPDTAVITQATLAIRVNAITGGGNPLKMFNYFMIDVINGSFGSSALAAQDFQLSPTVSAGPLGQTNTGGGWLYIGLKNGKTGINLTGLTQVRLRYSLGDNDNGIENILKFYSGNYATAKHRPQLNVWYSIP